VDTKGVQTRSYAVSYFHESWQLDSCFGIFTSNATVVLQILVGHGHWDLLDRLDATITTLSLAATGKNHRDDGDGRPAGGNRAAV
jgi:hypothetical protein